MREVSCLRYILLVGVFDCTGHGVPGAFMSILGVTLLNEMVNRDNIYKPNLILDRLRNKIIYSGAYNSLYHIRDNEIFQFKSDRMPLSHSASIKDFSSHEIDIQPGDMIYLSTDGYISQSGGQNLKRFKSRQFKEVLLLNHEYPLQLQKQMLHDTFDNWKGQCEQVDDITIVGSKF